eukprot:GHVN01054516.1.p1 GENE.GHVN01054516.1~~GHVN01054516.1.p1  ORF type:complete len:105 (+),score=6.30 GHVN01054516.1:181-495(+)
MTYILAPIVHESSTDTFTHFMPISVLVILFNKRIHSSSLTSTYISNTSPTNLKSNSYTPQHHKYGKPWTKFGAERRKVTGNSGRIKRKCAVQKKLICKKIVRDK